MPEQQMVKMKVKAVKVGNSVRVAIPSEVLKAAGIKKGDVLLVDYDEKRHVITLEKEDVAKDGEALTV
jgi:bifunctional DNA-binding transcriptional regulator/antitoxin component of YhaV-PrlF toxin-antitoxin module